MISRGYWTNLFKQSFSENQQGIGPNPVPPIQALAVMAVIEAANRSAREKASVGPDLTDEEIAAWP